MVGRGDGRFEVRGVAWATSIEERGKLLCLWQNESKIEKKRGDNA